MLLKFPIICFSLFISMPAWAIPVDIKDKINSYINNNGWSSYSSFSEGDIDGDGVKEIAILAQKKSAGITDTTALVLGIAKKGDKLIPLFENSKLIPKITPLGYYDDDIKIKNKALIAFYSRGTGSRTSVTNVFKYSAKTLILEKQTLLNTNSSESNITEYYPLDGKFVLTKERECYRDEKDCDNFKEEKTTEKIAYKKITFEEYCFSISKEIASRFDCLKQQYPTVNTKAYLHKDLNKPTKMYLIKGDKVTLLDEKTDDSTQKWYFINYKGTKDLNMWIKAEAVDIPKEEKPVLEEVRKTHQSSENSPNTTLAVTKEKMETPVSKKEVSIASTDGIGVTQLEQKKSAGGSMPLSLFASLLGVLVFKLS